MKMFLRLSGLILVGAAWVASAIPITLDPTSASLVLWGDDPSQSVINEALNSQFPGLNLLYDGSRAEGNSVGISGGSFAASYGTTFYNSDLADSDARIAWRNGTPYINSLPVYALIKDGNSVPNWYVFNISGWNGMDSIEFQGFYVGTKQTKDVSHVSIYGNQTTLVPDGASTVALLGVALFGLMGLRRMFF